MVKRSFGRTRDIPTLIDNKGRLPSGLEGQNIPDDFSIPSVGVEDVDVSVFNLFNDRINFNVKQESTLKKVPVIFAGGERFALAKKNTPFRDRNKKLILPLISIRRSSIDQTLGGTFGGMGIGENTGEIVIKKKLSREDPKFQNLINKIGLENQDNVTSEKNKTQDSRPEGSSSGKVYSRRGNTGVKSTGNILDANLGKNIYEIITIPFPQFFTVTYEITFWTQYLQHMNQMVEKLLTSYDAQGNQFRLDVKDKGYWFVGYVDDNFDMDDNFRDYTENERMVRVNLSMKVTAYAIASKNPGDPIPFRKFLSAPQLSFGIFEGETPINPNDNPVGSGDKNKFVLNEIDILDKRGDRVNDPRTKTEFIQDFVDDPFSKSKKPVKLKVLSRNQRSGETVFKKRDLNKIDDINF